MINCCRKIGDIGTTKIKINNKEWPDRKVKIYSEEILKILISIKKE